MNHKEKVLHLCMILIAGSVTFFFNVPNAVLLRKEICNVKISLVFAFKEREQLTRNPLENRVIVPTSGQKSDHALRATLWCRKTF